MQKCVVDHPVSAERSFGDTAGQRSICSWAKNHFDIDLMNHEDDLTETEVVVDLEFCILKFSLLVYLLVDFFLCDSAAIYSISISFFFAPSSGHLFQNSASLCWGVFGDPSDLSLWPLSHICLKKSL